MVAEQGKAIGKLSGLFITLNYVSLGMFITLLLSILVILIFHKKSEKLPMIFGALEIIGYITLMIVYMIILSDIGQVDLDMMQYIVDNECSDAVLMHSIVEYNKQFTADNS